MLRLADRLIGVANRLTQRSLDSGNASRERALRRRAFYAGAIGCGLQDLADLEVHRASGSTGAIAVVGRESERLEIGHLLFPGEPLNWEPLERVTLQRLRRACRRLLDSHVDLVVCDVTSIARMASGFAFRWQVPSALDHVLTLPKPIDTLLAGGPMKDFRNRLRKSERNGYAARVTHDEADLDRFYRDIYLPQVRKRHGERAYVATWPELVSYFGRGGLMLISIEDRVVGGAVCYRMGEVFIGAEKAIVEDEEQPLKHGLSQVVDWHCFVWASSEGAQRIELGRSRAYCTNGLLLNKSMWGADLRWPKYEYRQWQFYADHLPQPLLSRLNDAGLISRIGDEFHRILIADALGNTSAAAKETAMSQARSRHLTGVAVVGKHPRLSVVRCDATFPVDVHNSVASAS
jgi:hypothetical protein